MTAARLRRLPSTAAPCRAGRLAPSAALAVAIAAAITASSAAMASSSLQPDAAAKDYFGSMQEPAPLAARAIGSYARGCLAGANALPINGPSWQVMRLSRNRNWGHPDLIAYLQDLARASPGVGWNGLLVGDLAQPRGGPMTSGHSSHQIGLDADIWLTPMPNRVLTADERETMSAISMVKQPQDRAGVDRSVDPARWTDTHAALIRVAARDKRVARIFVNPAIKKALCAFETGDRAWLNKVRPWWGHDYHFHVRIACPAGSIGCSDQDPPPPGDGCGADLAWWLSDEPWVPKLDPVTGKPPPVEKKRPMALSALPKDCTSVLTAR
ncbi:penicillin-insensitive murein endopeptidase [Pannonibacter tanglangensis]|nr:penicillin-insensitive murein endopeptidase [Pannonibacter sp. XCT-53]